MRQILHIFRKDLRHFWPEIALVCGLTLAYGWLYSAGLGSMSTADAQATGFHLNPRQWDILNYTIATLLPVSWLVLIARAVHSENLVGNRQFWLTRPYRWQSLLVAKLLFFCMAILVPFILLQVYLLHASGIPGGLTLSGLAFATLNILLIVLLFFALAAVTSSLPRIVAVLLSAATVTVVLIFLASTYHSVPSPDVYVPYHDRLSLPAVIVLCTVILLLQYRSRRLWVARAFLLLVPLTLAVLVAFPYERVLFSSSYPVRSSAQSQLTIRLERNWLLSPQPKVPRLQNFALEVSLSGIAPGTALSAENARLTLTAPDGTHAETTWESIPMSERMEATGRKTLSFQDPQSFVHAHLDQPLTLRLDLAFTQVIAGESQSVQATGGGAVESLPGIGLCSTQAEYFNGMGCTVAFRPPHLTRITAIAQPFPCQSTANPTTALSTAWTGNLLPEPSEFSFTPVHSDFVQFQDPRTPEPGKPLPPLVLCKGAQITLTTYHLLRHFQQQAIFEGITFHTE